MRYLRHLFNRILRNIWPKKPGRPEDIPKKLSDESLEALMREARYLRAEYRVDVQDMAPDEVPGLPRRADR